MIVDNSGSGSSIPVPVRKSARAPVPKRYFDVEGRTDALISLDADEPNSFQEVVDSPNSVAWRIAMLDELDSMMKNGVWDLVDLPSNRRVIGNKWVLKVKRKSDGTIELVNGAI